MRCESVILAAGLGTRMHSSLPKAFHRLAGRELLRWAEAAAREAIGRPPVVVIGPEMGSARSLLPDDVRFVVQNERRGTGHALLQAAPALRGACDAVLVTTSDMPLLSPETLKGVIAAQASHDAPLTLLSVTAADPRGFGRVVRGEAGRVTAVVEETEAQPEQLAIRELNASVYCFRADWLWDRLSALTVSGRGEYLLTDVVAAAASEGGVVAVSASDDEETLGINTRGHLSEAEAILRRRINRAWMLAGVTMADPATTYIAPEVLLGADTVLLPNTHLEGNSSIGSGCVVGPNSIVRDSAVGDGCRIEALRAGGMRAGRGCPRWPVCASAAGRPARSWRPHGQLRGSQEQHARGRRQDGPLLLRRRRRRRRRDQHRRRYDHVQFRAGRAQESD